MVVLPGRSIREYLLIGAVDLASLRRQEIPYSAPTGPGPSSVPKKKILQPSGVRSTITR